ncbi:MAG: LCP family protein [Bacillota bacterium]|nr:LCP family protein [Bacillota bacterium]
MNDNKPFYKTIAFYVSLVTLGAVLYLVFQLLRLNLLPPKYFYIVAGFLAAILAADLFMLNWKNKNLFVSVVAYVCSAAIIACSCFGSYVFNMTFTTLENMTTTKNSSDETTHYVKLYALSDFTQKKLDGIEGQTIGVLKNYSRKYVEKALRELFDQGYHFKITEYDSSIEMMNNFKGKAINYIMMDETYLPTIEDYEGFEEITDLMIELYSYAFKVKLEDTSKQAVDVTTTPFTVLVSGSDSRVGIEEVARSDVNMVICINPVTHIVLMISIPRDYYVETACEEKMGCAVGKMDKLTHTGLHGIGTTEATIEKFLNVEINYNATVTFNTVTKLVDALGGITIANSEEVTLNDHKYEVGNIRVNGEQALRYARERYSYASGDRQRGKNQMAVVKGIIKKMLSPQLLKNFSGIMNAISGTFRTNMEVSDMMKLVNKQLEDNPSWKIYQYSLDGNSGTDYAYELGDYASVMYPNEETIHRAKTDIQAIYNGEVPPYKAE